MNIEQLENKKEAVSSSSNSGLHNEVFEEMAKNSSVSSNRDSRDNGRNTDSLEFDNIFKTDLKVSLDSRDVSNKDGKSADGKFIDLKTAEKTDGRDKNSIAEKELSKDKSEGKNKNEGKDKSEGKDKGEEKDKNEGKDKNEIVKDKDKDKDKSKDKSKDKDLENEKAKDKAAEKKADEKKADEKAKIEPKVSGDTKDKTDSVSRTGQAGGSRIDDIQRMPTDRTDHRQERQMPRRSAF
jgi:hypothetical protein